MIKSAITLSLVEEARGGPFVLWDGLEKSIEKAKGFGFDAVEIFTPAPDAIDPDYLKKLLDDQGLELAAVGTGAGMVKHKLHLCDPDEAQRTKARDFIRHIMDFAGQFGAPAIIGSMQGRYGAKDAGLVDQETAMGYLGEALQLLDTHAKALGTKLIYEPLNRYETNLCNTQGAGAEMLTSLGTSNVVLLADLFHMNIEETTIAGGLRDGGDHVGHVHFVDSTRRPTGYGHMNYEPIAVALKEIGYAGYLSAEAFPYPDGDTACKATMEAYNKYIKPLND